MNRSQPLTSEMLLPAPVGGGFSMDGYWVWCGSVIRGEDGRYICLPPAGPKRCPFTPAGASPAKLCGPTAIPPRAPIPSGR